MQLKGAQGGELGQDGERCWVIGTAESPQGRQCGLPTLRRAPLLIGPFKEVLCEGDAGQALQVAGDRWWQDHTLRKWQFERLQRRQRRQQGGLLGQAGNAKLEEL
eukprot:CAMPEP_0202925206 /NCGR_PEP_ID=MMETSP1392-20130828/79374_1 /ASSEMBLY_ACC=CAM_ASM_000868 /TAXON_ID=225041 /ORGANISM="Chlamydomonas chlamydogama, Strain SAG 11-48b" /LENGTH=104 /DNA_ID=CAMNT_0049618971 /DNA_START=1814 /DNA_END=2128 /DNA_ORIENTATION=-